MAVQPNEGPRDMRLGGVVRSTVALACFAIPFLAAGRADWAPAWIMAGLMLFTVASNAVIGERCNPGTLRARMAPMRAIVPEDRIFLSMLLPTFLAMFVVAGLDGGRFGWSHMRPAWIYAGIALHVAGDIPALWAFATNPFLEPVVRIQKERGHRVITTGPYRLVRHPYNLGSIVMMAGWPLILMSWWAFVPYAVLAALVVYRTTFEDRFLQRDLEGYREYAQRTRYRLLPGIW